MAFNEIAEGEFVWQRLMVEDVNSAKMFYNSLFGWESYEVPYDDRAYTIFTLDGKNMAGLMQVPDAYANQVRPHWLTFLKVNDLRISIEKATSLGTSLFTPIKLISGIGEFAVIQDPSGAYVGLFQPLHP